MEEPRDGVNLSSPIDTWKEATWNMLIELGHVMTLK